MKRAPTPIMGGGSYAKRAPFEGLDMEALIGELHDFFTVHHTMVCLCVCVCVCLIVCTCVFTCVRHEE